MSDHRAIALTRTRLAAVTEQLETCKTLASYFHTQKEFSSWAKMMQRCKAYKAQLAILAASDTATTR